MSYDNIMIRKIDGYYIVQYDCSRRCELDTSISLIFVELGFPDTSSIPAAKLDRIGKIMKYP